MTPGSGTVVDPRTTLAMWLRDGRARKKLSLDDVARITKIQVRILEKFETGQLDGMPAEVFVKGFVRSFARCIGLDESEALDRYTAAKSSPMSRALVESMSELAPVIARTTRPMEVVEVEAPEIVESVPPISEVSVLPPPVEVSASDLPVVDISLSDLPAITSSAEIPVAAPAKKKRTRRKAASVDGAPVEGAEAAPKRTRSRKKKVALGTPAEPTPVVAAPAESVAVEAAPAEPVAAEAAPVEPVAATVEAAPIEAALSSASEAMELEVAAVVDAASGPIAIEPAPIEIAIEESTVDTTIAAEGSGHYSESHGTWRPTMPPLATTSSVPWRRPTLPAATLPVTPSLVIDDADPDRAEREQEERATLREPHKVSFLPPILLDREDKSARQGGLTLAVIILLIAATLTLSYLMRRPSVSGDGVTMRETPATLA